MISSSVNREHCLGIRLVGAVYRPENLIFGAHKVIADRVGQLFFTDLRKQVKNYRSRVHYQLAVYLINHITLQVPDFIAFGDVIRAYGSRLALNRPAQEIIGRYLKVIRRLYQKIKSALADSLLIVRQKRLGNPQILRYLLLAESAFLA